MKITERRIVEQQWYETELSKTGWEIVQHLYTDKFGNSWLGIAEKETKINENGK